MTAMDIRRVDHPSAWKACDIGGREGLIHRLGQEHLDAFEDLLQATKDTPIFEIRRDSFRSQAIDNLMAATRDTIVNGRGAMVLSGLDISGRPLEDYERIYWYLGTHLGNAVMQSAKGDLLGYVRHVTESKARGYLSDMELGPHTDYHEVLSLAGVRVASKGGLSGMTSALAVHNEMLATRPDLLEVLYEGYYNGIPFRYGVNDSEYGRRRVPVFSNTGGQVSVFTLSFMQDAAHARGETIPDEINEAFAYMRQIASSEDFQARFMLQPGEMMFWNNRVVFHSRTRFPATNGYCCGSGWTCRTAGRSIPTSPPAPP
ncbi:MAG: TauD/TfdA family dioxygenase [Caulobacteraceae bacterium]